MAGGTWPSKAAAERWEIEAFLAHYSRLPDGRMLEVMTKRERPDWVVRDLATRELLGVELTSVYRDDRSVPDLHQRDGMLRIPFLKREMAAYGKRLAATVKKKARLARAGYDTSLPLILSICAYVTIHMGESDWHDAVRAHNETFDDLWRFTELVIWPLVNGGVLRITSWSMNENARENQVGSLTCAKWWPV